LGARGVLVVGLLVSIVYIYVIVYFQSSTDKKVSLQDGNPKFLLLQKKDEIKIVSKLSEMDKNSSLIQEVENLCNLKSCSKEITFAPIATESDFCDFMGKLLFFIKDHNLSKASVIADGQEIEINFLVSNKDELKSLKELYKEYKTDFNIEDSSSVLKYFSVEQIENSLDALLEKESIEIDSDTINFKTRKSLNKVFRKLRALGNVNIELHLDLEDEKQEVLKDFIKRNYPWVKDIEIKKDKNKSIKIKEVLT